MAKGTVNKVIVLGRLGQDPDLRATASGTAVANINVATNELGPKDPQSGQHQTQTEWHKIILFGRMAENANTYLRKGSQVYIEGRLQTRKWKDQQGFEKYSTEIVASEMQFIGGNPNEQSSQGGLPTQQGTPGTGFGGNQPTQGFGGAQSTGAGGQPTTTAQSPAYGGVPGGGDDWMEDSEIPF